MRNSARLAPVLLAVIATGLSGCGGAAEVRKLTVTATLDGKSLADADIQFAPKDDMTLGGSSGRTAADGKVEIIMNKSMKMKTGRFVALVTKMVDASGKPFKAASELAIPVAGDLPPGGPRNSLPAVYSDPAQSPLIVTIGAGEPAVELKLVSKP